MAPSALTSLILALGLFSEQNTKPQLGRLIRRRHLSVNGISLLLADENIEAYEYSSEAELEHEIRSLRRTPQLQAQSDWIQTYGFKKDRLLVLYTGSSQPLLGLVSQVMGPCFLEP